MCLVNQNAHCCHFISSYSSSSSYYYSFIFFSFFLLLPPPQRKKKRDTLVMLQNLCRNTENLQLFFSNDIKNNNKEKTKRNLHKTYFSPSTNGWDMSKFPFSSIFIYQYRTDLCCFLSPSNPCLALVIKNLQVIQKKIMLLKTSCNNKNTYRF